MKMTVKLLRPAFACFLIMTLLCGVVYTAAVTGAAQLLFPFQANGSVIALPAADGGAITYGSTLLAQEFTQARYLIGRPSGVTNLNPASAAQQALVAARVAQWHALDPDNGQLLPVELVTASGSGVDPDISPAGAAYQAARIARARGISQADVQAVIDRFTTGRLLGVFGEPAVNVLKVNLALDGVQYQ